MKIVMALAALLSWCLVPPAAANPRSLEAVVRSLGNGTTRDDYDVLERHRCSAPARLVQQLEAVPPQTVEHADEARHPRTMHVVEVLAALRFLTGRDFYGPLDRRYNGDGLQFLTADLPPGKARFSSIWMSRLTTYIAPIRTQRAIIRQWRVFVMKAWDCRKPANPRRRDDFFFRYGDVAR